MTRLFEALSPARAAKGMYWDRAWSLVQGCTPVSAACDRCWAASQAHMRASNPNAKVAAANAGLTWLSGERKGAFNGTVRINYDVGELPSRTRKPCVWAIWTDLFHASVPEQEIRYVIEEMHEAAHHTFIVLTKRPERMAQFDMRGPNIIVGVTAEDQATANERIPHLLATEATYRMVSVEPMLGPVDIMNYLEPHGYDCSCGHSVHYEMEENIKTRDVKTGFRTECMPVCEDCNGGATWIGYDPHIHWVVCGGETGPGARPMHPEWARSMRDQCQAAGVPLWFKGWGEWADIGFRRFEDPYSHMQQFPWDPDCTMARVGKARAGALLDGKLWRETP